MGRLFLPTPTFPNPAACPMDAASSGGTSPGDGEHRGHARRASMVLAPFTGRGAATRWGSQAAQRVARTSGCTALPQRVPPFAVPCSAPCPPQGHSSRVYLCTC